jgi:hypothetical protein
MNSSRVCFCISRVSQTAFAPSLSVQLFAFEAFIQLRLIIQIILLLILLIPAATGLSTMGALCYNPAVLRTPLASQAIP